VSAELDAAWQVVVDKWDDQSAHDKLLALVATSSSYKWAATQYKQRAGDPIAEAQLERIRKAAIATMFSAGAKKRDADAPYKRVVVLLIVLLFMMVLGLVGLKLIHDLHR
jgi:hypothetical protein